MDGFRRRPFTLIEILISVAILTILASLTCFQGLKALGDFSYKQCVKKLQEELCFASSLSLTSSADIHFALYWDKGVLKGVYLFDDTDLSIDPILREKRSYEKIQELYIDNEKIEDRKVLTFSSKNRAALDQIEIAVAQIGQEPVYIKIQDKISS